MPTSSLTYDTRVCFVAGAALSLADQATFLSIIINKAIGFDTQTSTVIGILTVLINACALWNQAPSDEELHPSLADYSTAVPLGIFGLPAILALVAL